MIKRPDYFIDDYIKAGADMITVHIETITPAKIKSEASRLKGKGIKIGVSLNPPTPLARIKGVLSEIDFVLVMTVNPGFSGQKFIPQVLPKIRKLRRIFDREIAVDGGINDKVAGDLINAGVDTLSAASFIFGSDNYKQAIERLRNAR
jgi:ribulose-phosphate 3-epimerase